MRWIKYSLFCSWQVNNLKTKLTSKSLTQVCDVNKVCAKPTFPLSRIRENQQSFCPQPTRVCQGTHTSLVTFSMFCYNLRCQSAVLNNSTQLKFIKNKTTKINDIKTMKKTLQNKNSTVTVSMHVLQTAIYIR